MPKTSYPPAPWRKAPKELVDRLKAYQKERGLKVDGKAGVQSVDQLLLDVVHAPAPPDVPKPREPKARNWLVWLFVAIVVTAAAAGLARF